METPSITNIIESLRQSETLEQIVNCHSFALGVIKKYLGMDDGAAEIGSEKCTKELLDLIFNIGPEQGFVYNVLELTAGEHVCRIFNNPADIASQLKDNLVTYHIFAPIFKPEEKASSNLEHSGVIMPAHSQENIEKPEELLVTERESSTIVARRIKERTSGISEKRLNDVLEYYRPLGNQIIFAVWRKPVSISAAASID